MRPGLLPARSVMPAFVFFCHAPLDGASPLNEVNEKAPVYDRGFLKCVTPRSAAHS